MTSMTVRATAELATVLASRYRLKATDATHLATAVNVGADRFITNNRRDFPATITEVTSVELTHGGRAALDQYTAVLRDLLDSASGSAPDADS